MFNDGKQLQEKFVALMKERVPKNLTNLLMDILPLEKEAIYRRMRGDVPFTFAEVAAISSQLSISLDSLTVIASPYRSQSFQLHYRDYSKYSAVDLFMSESYINIINRAAENPHSEFGIAANTLPLHISLFHPYIYRVYLLKWWYQFGKSSAQPLSYSSIKVPQEEEITYVEYMDAIQKIKHTYFIWDSTFFISLINDIKYFYKIRLIDENNMQLLKREMGRLLDTLEQYADTGKFSETGNKVEMYISILNFDTTYSYLMSDDIYVSMSSVYGLDAYTSLEQEPCVVMKQWIQGLKKTSTLISDTSQLERIRFFKQQRAILEEQFSDENINS